jgi:hypothetical protein
MLEIRSRLEDPKFDNIGLVLRASQIRRELNCSFTAAFAQAEAEVRQQPAAHRPGVVTAAQRPMTSSGIVMGQCDQRRLESIVIYSGAVEVVKGTSD